MTATSGLPTWARRLEELRRSQVWIASDTARALKERGGSSLPSVKHLTHMVRADWESGKHRPGPRYRALLSAVYGVDESDIFESTVSGEDADELERRQLLQALALLGVTASPAAGALQNIHDSVDRAVGRGESHHIEDWEETLHEYGYSFISRPPHLLIGELAADLVAVHQVMTRTRSQDRLYPSWCRVTSGLSALMAKTLSNLGQPRESRTWWNTAQHAADESGDADLRMWVSGERVVYGLYERRPTPLLLRQADAAVQSASDTARRGLVHVRTVRAQLLAMSGTRIEALHEIERSREVFQGLPSAVTCDIGSVVTGWAEHRLHYTEAWVNAHLGECEPLDRAVARVHQLLPSAHHRMGVQIDLLQAFGRIRAGDVTEGVRLARDTYSAYPPEQRTVMVTALADQIWEAVPTARRADPGIADFSELLVTGSAQRRAIT